MRIKIKYEIPLIGCDGEDIDEVLSIESIDNQIVKVIVYNQSFYVKIDDLSQVAYLIGGGYGACSK